MSRETSVNRTVLVIDDNEFALALTQKMLQQAGYTVATRNRPAGSVAAILREKPDIVLVEVNMPNLSGEAIAKILSRSLPRPNAIVLLHSALPVETLRLKAVSAGAHGYVQKTDHAPEFLRRLDQALAKARGTSSARLAAVQSARDEDASPERAPALARPAEPYIVPPSEPRSDRHRAVDGHLPPMRANRLRTLFVDDDWSLLRAYRSTMGDDLDAEFLTSGEEAIGRLLSDTPPDILVCDIVMPYVTGADLYTRAVSIDPTWAQRFLFLTGASSTRVVIDFMNQHEGRVLFKPVPHNRLLDAIYKIGAAIPTR